MPKKMTKITMSELLLSAIFYLQQKNGVTAKEITKYICEKRGCAQKHMKDSVKKALERATVRGIFCKKRGLYRINNTFGLNKVLNKTKRRGQKANKETKVKENGSEEKSKFKTLWEKRSERTLLREIVDKRMNDDYDNLIFYVEFPVSCDDDDDEDFKDSEDDEDEYDFFSDDMGESPANAHSAKAEPAMISLNGSANNNSLQEMSDCHSFTDPFTKHVNREEYLDITITREKLQDRKSEEKKISRGRKKSIREKSKKPSEDPSETVPYNCRNQVEEDDWDADQPLEEMEWDCQPNDLESIERLLERDKQAMESSQRKNVGIGVGRENNSRIRVFIENLPTDNFEVSHTKENTR